MANARKKHINVTIFFSNAPNKLYDVRIPMQITVKQLIRELYKIFNYHDKLPIYQINIQNKGIILYDNDELYLYPISDGDIIEIFNKEVMN